MECKFSKSRNKDKGAVQLDDEEILKSESFWYLGSIIFLFLGSIIHKDGEIEEDVNHRIRVGWMKWRGALGVLCDCKIPIMLKGKFL